MVHFIFLLKTSHLKEHYKIGFTIFGSAEPEIWFLQKQLNPKPTKEKRERLTEGPHESRNPTRQWLESRGATWPPEISSTARSRRWPRAPSCSPLHSASSGTRNPNSTGHKVPHPRKWRHGGGARPTADVSGRRQSGTECGRASAWPSGAFGTRMRKNGGLQSPGHDAGDHGGAPAR